MPTYSSNQGIVTMGMIYDQSVLWNADEDVNLEEKKEYIDEAMIEVAQKMKRKHNLSVMTEYSFLGWQDNSALVEYPDPRLILGPLYWYESAELSYMLYYVASK